MISSLAACTVFACVGLILMQSNKGSVKVAELSSAAAASQPDMIAIDSRHSSRNDSGSSAYHSEYSEGTPKNESSTGSIYAASSKADESSSESGSNDNNSSSAYISEISGQHYDSVPSLPDSETGFEYKSSVTVTESISEHESSAYAAESNIKYESYDPSDEPSCDSPYEESSYYELPEAQPVEIYYSDNGELKKKTVNIVRDEEKAYELWRVENHIGDEVKFLYSLYEVDGERISDPHFDLEKAAAPGHEKTLTNVVFITENFQDYYSRPDKEILLKSLELTILGACTYTPDEYRLELWQENKPISLIASDIYYSENGRIEKSHLYIDSDTDELFETWKIQNHIGDEVKFIVSLYELDGERLGDPHYSFSFTYYAVQKLEEAMSSGHEKPLIYTVYVSENFKNYYTRPDKELLLKSLEMTMLGACPYAPDEYRLELWDGTQPIDFVPDKAYNEEE